MCDAGRGMGGVVRGEGGGRRWLRGLRCEDRGVGGQGAHGTALGGWLSGPDAGQSTLEYALLLMAFVAMVAALAALWHVARDGSLLRLATSAASHTTSEGVVAALKDLGAF